MEIDKDFYIGLLFECPFLVELETCPFKQIRIMEVSERLKQYHLLQTTEYIEQHLECFLKREGKIEFTNRITNKG